MEKGNESRPSRRTKAVAVAYVEEMSRKLAMGSPPLHDDNSAEAFPELPASRRDKREPEQKPSLTAKKLTSEKMLSKSNSVKKNAVKNASPNRPSTRSMPSDEKAPEKLVVKNSKKTVIRDLIQKKKQMSLRTLSRLKNLPTKIKPSLNATKPETKGGAKVEKKEYSSEKKNDLEVEPSRRLRGKIAEIIGPLEKTSANKVKKQMLKKPVEVKVKEPVVENKGKAKQRTEVSEAVPSKRPVRKCSTVDKMWIDVDGFTSDEEDFIDLESIAAGAGDKKASAEVTASTKIKNVSNAVDSVVSSRSDKTDKSVADTNASNKGKCISKPVESVNSSTPDKKSTIEREKGTSKAVESTNTSGSKSTLDSIPANKGKIATKVVESTPSTAKKSTAEVTNSNKGKSGNKAVTSQLGRKEESTDLKKPNDSTTPTAGKETKVKKSEKKEEPASKLLRKNASLENSKVKKDVADSVHKVASPETSKRSAPSATKAASSRKPENISSLNVLDKGSLPLAATGVKPFVVETAVSSPLCNPPVKISHQPVREIIPKEASPVISSLNASLPLSPSKSAAWLVPRCSSTSGGSTNEPWKGKTPGEASRSLHSMTVAPSPVSQVESSHALIARLASNVSMTSKPSSFTLDLKSVTKDLNTTCTPSAYSSIIKEENFLKAEMNFSEDVDEQSRHSFDVEDKKHIVGLCEPAPNVNSGKAPETKVSGSDFRAEEKSSVRRKLDNILCKEEDTTTTIESNTKPPAAQKRVASTVTKEVGNKRDLILFTTQSKSKVTPMTHRQKGQKSTVALQAGSGNSSKEGEEASKRQQKIPLVKSQKEKIMKTKGGGSGNKEKNKNSGLGDRALKSRVAGGSSAQKSREEDMETSDDSSDSSERLFKSSTRSSGKRVRRPSPRAEVVTRRERPKRQCSATGKSWIERDSDDSSFYDDGEEDVLELIRRSELALKEREAQKQRAIKEATSVSCKGGGSDTFSESDDEPLMKKTLSAPSPGSPRMNETNEVVLTKNCAGKSEVSQECVTRAGTSGLNGGRNDDRDSVPAPAVTFLQVPREPINTHGLDLLSEVVAVADKSEKSTERIEQWLKESLRADAGKGFVGFDESEIRRPPLPSTNSSIPDPVLQFVRSSPEKPKPPPELKKVTAKHEVVLKRPPVLSITDLVKLQKERKESPKPATEQHSKNCKCNSCVVKKGWFKNKPVPDDAKPLLTKDTSPPKPFQALTQAFGEVATSKASVSVAPFVQSRDNSDGKPSGTRKLSFLERMRERERKESLVKLSQPFSPSNESSVYAFEPEAERQGVPSRNAPQVALTTPARTQPRPAPRAHSTSACHEEDPDGARHQSTSIAVQVNFPLYCPALLPIF